MTEKLSANDASNASLQEYTRTVFENYEADVPVDDKLVKLELWDTGGKNRVPC